MKLRAALNLAAFFGGRKVRKFVNKVFEVLDNRDMVSDVKRRIEPAIKKDSGVRMSRDETVALGFFLRAIDDLAAEFDKATKRKR